MQSSKWRVITRAGAAVVVLGIAPVSVALAAGEEPGSIEGSSIPPSKVIAERPLYRPPPLTGQGDEARKNVNAFVTWAGESVALEREMGRKVLREAAKNPEIVKALTEEALVAQRNGDTSRGLVALGLLGEMRTYDGAKFLVEFVRMPLPKEGTYIEGELQEEAQQAMLQAKAVAGLAYMRSADFDREVLYQSGKHPSVIVRAEAISAYLWNQGDSLEARKLLSSYVRPEERLFLDRVRRVAGEGAETFNKKLALYLEAHPELKAPKPEPKEPRPPEEKPYIFDENPPEF